MVSTRQVLTVFMASPGDVARERAELAAAVNRVNRRSARELGWLIELRGWEDTMPGVGRPQSRINPEVETCDVFIGILWKRWGTATGTSSSGFQEEFEIAQERRSRTADPEILMYFKTVDEDLRSDPGEQLRRVMDFKARLTAERKILYKAYDTVDEFTSLVEEHLTRVVHARAAERIPAAEEAPSPGDAEFTDDVQRFEDAGTIELPALMGNPYLDAGTAIARWAAAEQARDIALAPCAVGNGRLWSFDPFDPDYGLSLIVGQTGSGKSNAILSMAFSLAFSLPPEFLRFSILDLEGFQSVRILETIGATLLPIGYGFDPDAVIEEARRREGSLRALGHRSMRSLWRRDPALRKEFPVWVICADEALRLVRDPDALDRLVAIAGRVAGLGIHFVLGSQSLGSLGELALATRARRIALPMFDAGDYADFAGVPDPFRHSSGTRPGLAVCADADSVTQLRFALVDDRSLADSIMAASQEWDARPVTTRAARRDA